MPDISEEQEADTATGKKRKRKNQDAQATPSKHPRKSDSVENDVLSGETPSIRQRAHDWLLKRMDYLATKSPLTPSEVKEREELHTNPDLALRTIEFKLENEEKQRRSLFGSRHIGSKHGMDDKIDLMVLEGDKAFNDAPVEDKQELAEWIKSEARPWVNMIKVYLVCQLASYIWFAFATVYPQTYQGADQDVYFVLFNVALAIVILGIITKHNKVGVRLAHRGLVVSFLASFVPFACQISEISTCNSNSSNDIPLRPGSTCPDTLGFGIFNLVVWIIIIITTGCAWYAIRQFVNNKKFHYVDLAEAHLEQEEYIRKRSLRKSQ